MRSFLDVAVLATASSLLVNAAPFNPHFKDYTASGPYHYGSASATSTSSVLPTSASAWISTKYNTSTTAFASGARPTGYSNTTAPIRVSTGHAASSGYPPAPSNTSTASPAAMPYPLHGVNLGNWLVLESWMNSTLFEGTDACDQWTFDSTPDAESKLQSHWATYITEDDFKTMASYGINAVRIPIGYWAYDNTNTPYIQGADAYLEKAIGWARNTGIKVLVDCHGSPGSQNGFDNSGRKGNVKWQTEDNLQLSIKVLEKMAAKYGSLEYADVVFGLELVNEPISWEENDFGTTKQWAEEAYAAVEKAAANKHLQIMMHDGFMGPDEWVHIGESVNVKASKDQARFVVDTHLYQNQMPDDSKLTQEEHIEKACNWTKSNLLPGSANLPVYVGEFSAATDICANPDGSTVAGTTCWIDGCQCANNVPIEDWQQPLKDATRKYMEAQMEAFDHSTQGWFLWSYHGYGAWGLDAMMKNGVLGKTLTDRKYSGICGF